MISCEQHDYIEIACMYRFRVSLQLDTGDIVEGIALDTKTNSTGQECIELKLSDKNILVATDSVLRMDALTRNKHFKFITFRSIAAD